MKPTDIQIGKTYRNRGAGTTTRTVLDIGEHVPGSFTWENSIRIRVKYRQQYGTDDEVERTLSLNSFAQWAGSEVKRDDQCPKCGESYDPVKYGEYECPKCGVVGSSKCCNPGGNNCLCAECEEEGK